MKHLLLALLFFPLGAARAAEPAPELAGLERKLTDEKAAQAKGSVSAEQHKAFLDAFRPELTATVSKAPPSSENSAAHARILMLLGDKDEAVAGLTRALKEHPKNPVLKMSLGHAYLEKQDFKRSNEAADEVLKSDPANKAALELKHASLGRGVPAAGGTTAAGASSAIKSSAGSSSLGSRVVFTAQAKSIPIVSDVPALAHDTEPVDGRSLPVWPLAAPLGVGLIGYGIYRNRRPGEGKESSIDLTPTAIGPIAEGVDKGEGTTWGKNAPFAKPTEVTPAEITENRRRFRTVALATGVLVVGFGVASAVPLIVGGIEAFVVSVGPAAGGGLVPVFAGVGSGAAAAALNPVAVAAGAKVAAGVVVVAAEAKVASDYYSYSNKNDEPANEPLKTTKHGSERLAGENPGRDGVLNEAESREARDSGRVLNQSGGGKVYLQEVEPGKFNAYVENPAGQRITTFRHLRMNKLLKLARNYGWIGL